MTRTIIPTRQAAAVGAALAAFTSSIEAMAQTAVDVALSHTYKAYTHGQSFWGYSVRNAGSGAIAANRRYTIKIAVPGPHKVYYIDTVNSLAKWTCEPPYDTNPVGGSLRRSGPATVVCHFDSVSELGPGGPGPGGMLPTLLAYTTGGDPARLCAVVGVLESNAAGAPEIVDAAPANNESCRGDQPSDYDLWVGVIASGPTVQGGATYHVFKPSVENKGPGAVPPFSTLEFPEGSAGLAYKARIPAGTIIHSLEIYQGWRCKVPGVAPNFMEDFSVPLNGPALIKNAGDGTLPSIKLAADATITCEYRTPYPLGQDYLSYYGTSYSGSIVYTTRNWPASDPIHCASVSSLNPKIAENSTKGANNTACWNTVTSQSVAPPQ